MEDFSSKYFRGQGKLMLGDLDANYNPYNLVFIGDMTNAELTPDVQRDEIIENVTNTHAVGASWQNATRFNFSAAMRSIRHDHLALALQGTDTAKTAASVTDEAHTAKQGAFINLTNLQVSNVVVTGGGGSPTYVANTDYVVYPEDGQIEILTTAEGGSIADDAAILVDYDFAAQHHVKVNPSSLNKALVFAGINSTDGKRVRCEIYRIKLDPSVLSMITDSATDMSIAGSVELVSERTAGDQQYSWKTQD
jgi:hypothetical protein